MGDQLGSRASTAQLDGAVTIGALGCDASAKGAVTFGRRIVNTEPISLAFGDGHMRAASTQNRMFHLLNDGSLLTQGPLLMGPYRQGIGALFPMSAMQGCSTGMLLAIKGGKIAPTTTGQEIFGVCANQCGIILNAAPFYWHARYLTGEFGEVLTESYYDTDDLSTQTRPIENPDYDPRQPYVPRYKRPDEWPLIGLAGGLYVRIDQTVAAFDGVVASAKQGVGTKATGSTGAYRVVCMSIYRPYDAAKGYAVGLCNVGGLGGYA